MTMQKWDNMMINNELLDTFGVYHAVSGGIRYFDKASAG
jgi:hypothetical protein